MEPKGGGFGRSEASSFNPLWSLPMDSDEKVSWKSSCMESVGSQLRPQPLRPWPCFRLYTRAKDGTTIDLTGAMHISKLYLLLKWAQTWDIRRRVFYAIQACMGRWLRNKEINLIFFLFMAFYFNFNRRNICLAMSSTALKKLFSFSYVEKKIVLDCFYIHFHRPRKTFFSFEFLLCLKMVFVLF